MIHFVVSEDGRFGIDDYLASTWPGRMRESIRPITYPELFARTHLPRGTWVFSALDSLPPAGLEIAGLIRQTLSAAGQVRLLNDPQQVLRRYDLLDSLHRSGVNRFRAIRAHESWQELRFPVFLREENYHTGGISGILHNRAELARELRLARFKGLRPDGLLIVEFCDTSGGSGRYRKYSAFKIGDALLARYLNISRDWMVKSERVIMDKESAGEADRYIRENPHADWLQRIFEIAHIDYGRVDYGMLGNDPQVWEINTNPRLTTARSPRTRTPEEIRFRDLQRTGREYFHGQFWMAWQAIDSECEGPEIPCAIPAELMARWRTEAAARERKRRWFLRLARLASNPLLRHLRPQLESSARRVFGHITRMGRPYTK